MVLMRNSRDVYVLTAERLQMKDRLNPGTWTITLLSDTNGVPKNLELTDDSKTADAESAPFNQDIILYL